MRPTRWLGATLLLAVLGVVLASRHVGAPAVARNVAVGTFADLAVDAQTGRAFVGDDAEGAVHVLASPSGRLLHTAMVGVDPDGMAVDARRGRVYVADHSQGMLGNGQISGVITRGAYLDVLDARSGYVLGTFDVGPDPDDVAVDEQSGAIFIVTGDSVVTMLDARSGAVLSTTLLNPDVRGLAVDGRTARVFVVNGLGGSVSMLDAHTDAVLRTIVVGQQPGAIAVDQRRGRVYVVDNGDNTVGVLDARSGALLRRIAVDQNPGSIAVDERSGRVYVTNWGAMDSAGDPAGPGTVSVLDARRGRVECSISVGVAPGAVAVDERNGSVFIVNAGGSVRASDAWAWIPARWRRWLPFLPGQDASVHTVPGSVSVLHAGC